MALMAVLMHRHLEHPVDLERTLAMITVHDLVEAIAGDVPFFETGERKAMKRQRELEAIEEIRTSLPTETGELVAGLWHEFEDRATPEARFAGAIDNLEVQIQHNLADLRPGCRSSTTSSTPRSTAPAPRRLPGGVLRGGEGGLGAKLRAGGFDPDVVKARLGGTPPP